MGKLYKINEVFGPTLQGEGSYSGINCGFLRFAGCNLQCPFCDTDHTGGIWMDSNQILERVEQYEHLIITGGEPLLQIDEDLLVVLKDKKIHLETNGTLALGELIKYFYHITLSPKQTIINLEYCNDIKILYPVLSDDSTVKEIDYFKKRYPDAKVYLQPVSEKRKECIDFIFKYNLQNVLLREQGHKIWKLK
jgi:7-carboxy-7-deazaguanine synthase